VARVGQVLRLIAIGSLSAAPADSSSQLGQRLGWLGALSPRDAIQQRTSTHSQALAYLVRTWTQGTPPDGHTLVGLGFHDAMTSRRHHQHQRPLVVSSHRSAMQVPALEATFMMSAAAADAKSLGIPDERV